MPNGNWASERTFKVPAGHDLIITDVIWEQTNYRNPETHAYGRPSLWLQNGQGTSAGREIYLPTDAVGYSTSKMLSGQVHLNSGWVVGPYRSICTYVTTNNLDQGTVTVEPGRFEVFGYLVER